MLLFSTNEPNRVGLKNQENGNSKMKKTVGRMRAPTVPTEFLYNERFLRSVQTQLVIGIKTDTGMHPCAQEVHQIGW